MSKAKHTPGPSFRQPDRRREVFDLIPEAQISEHIRILREAAQGVIDAWRGRDLAGAVGKLVDALEATKPESRSPETRSPNAAIAKARGEA